MILKSEKKTCIKRNFDLTKRQKEVLNLLSKGKSNKEIASILELSENTVKAHLSIVYRVLHVKNRMNALIVSKKLFLNNGANKDN